MKIRDLLAAESIELNGKVTGKKEALDAMVDLMAKSGKINDVEAVSYTHLTLPTIA